LVFGKNPDVPGIAEEREEAILLANVIGCLAVRL
jgi:hypothetical protein